MTGTPARLARQDLGPALTFDPPARGDRVLVRPFRPDDLDDVHRFQSDPAVLPYIPWLLRTREETAEWIALRSDGVVASEGDHGAWAVERLDDGQVIGSVNLTWTSEAHAQAEVGFVLATDAQGRGYAAEATVLLLDAAFAALALHRAFARVDARNEPSLRLLRRLGLRQEAHLVGAEVHKGDRIDVVLFGVLAAEWPLVRGQHGSPRDRGDRAEIAALLSTFFAAFTSGPDVGTRLAHLRELFLPEAVVVKAGGGGPTTYDVEGFLTPRRDLLTSGELVEFREWEVAGRTHLHGDVAHHLSSYAKSWQQAGTAVEGRGMKSIQLVRTAGGWRISALAWVDEA